MRRSAMAPSATSRSKLLRFARTVGPMKRVCLALALALGACPAPDQKDAGAGGGLAMGGGVATGGGTGTGGGSSAGGGGQERDASVSGIFFTGSLDASGYVSSNGYAWLPSDGGSGAPGATFGSPCATGNDCVVLGYHAGCFSNGDAGFCTVDCPAESDLCDAGFACMRGLSFDDLGDDIGLCLPTCASASDCAAHAGFAVCSGPFVTFNPGFPLGALGCFPACATDSDCNGLLCNSATHRCVLPDAYLGAQCASDADCSDLGPGASCLVNERNPSNRYCTFACDPTAVGSEQCVSDYATLPDGGPVFVELKSCSGDSDCQFASRNTCNYFPHRHHALCTIRCASDADCPDGTCDAASGDCRQNAFWASDCAADSNCGLGLCVSDFHQPTHFNCTHTCFGDGECPGGAVCVFSPVAVDPQLGDFFYATDAGFCAPSCAADAGVCADPTTSCLPPVDPPEIDFAGSGNASSNFCWR